MSALSSSWLGWLLAVVAITVGYASWGWRGVMLAFSVTVFWLLLQFSRTVRVLRDAGRSPIGLVPSAVMFHARINAGMRLLDLVKQAQALGEKVSDSPETWAWHDAAGDRVTVQLDAARVSHWALQRAEPADAGGPAATATP